IRGTGDGSGKGKVVLARADMDALPIVEENEVDYRSKNDGVMHACGHDAHTAMLLGTARTLMDRRDQFAGAVKVLFQPSEEAGEGGAIGMIREGVLEDPHVDACFGLHVSSRIPTGKISVASGPLNAAADEFKITIQGKGGHGAYPHLCVDPVVIGAEIVVALQTLVSRDVDPTDKAVVSVCSFKAGEAFNVIPDTAMIGGTVRTFDQETRDLLDTRIHELATGVAAAMGGSVNIDYRRGYPPVINDEAMAGIVREAAREVVGEENVEMGKPKMGAEDFSYFALERPSCFFNVGTGNAEKETDISHHHPRFNIDEEGMAQGIATMATTLVSFLNRE
ncbi:MAG TPA: M20 family metallopeptidase, partial [Thermomicrobiales bacterium]|nr:M20 family metallopeptidase [Thermomicrobiales bacterium]